MGSAVFSFLCLFDFAVARKRDRDVQAHRKALAQERTCDVLTIHFMSRVLQPLLVKEVWTELQTAFVSRCACVFSGATVIMCFCAQIPKIREAGAGMLSERKDSGDQRGNRKRNDQTGFESTKRLRLIFLLDCACVSVISSLAIDQKLVSMRNVDVRIHSKQRSKMISAQNK